MLKGDDKIMDFKISKKLPIFVYGTLRSGQANHERCLMDRTEKELKGKVKGKLYSNMFGTFPCMIKGDGYVYGELMYIKDEFYDATLRQLDFLEGYDQEYPEESMYIREIVDIETENGEKVQAYAYYWNSENLGKPIPHGDWIKFLQEKEFDYRVIEAKH